MLHFVKTLSSSGVNPPMRQRLFQKSAEARRRQHTSIWASQVCIASLWNWVLAPIAKSKAKSKSKALSASEAFAWLPTADSQPISSLNDNLPAEGSCSIAPWAVSVLRLDWQQSLNLLMACGARRLLADEALQEARGERNLRR